MENDKYCSGDYAKNYEWLIRRAHQCGRSGVAGADTDTYRRFLRSATLYKKEKEAIDSNKPSHWSKSEQEVFADYMKCAGEISAYIRTSIDIVKRKFDKELTDKQFDELERAELLLHNPTLELIGKSIDIAEKVMLELKLFPK